MMAEDNVASRGETGPEEEKEKRATGQEGASTAKQNLSKRQMKKLLKQQKWEEERELRK